MADFSEKERSGAPEESLCAVFGTVDSVIFQNEENGYAVCAIADEEGDETIIIGTLPYITVGESIAAYGTWTNHPTFGRQLKVAYYEKVLPVSENDILHYLSSGAVKGVGPKTARRIVEKFGEDTFDVIENHPSWLAEIHGISAKSAEKISARFREQAGARSVMMFCRDFFGPATALRVYKRWGASAVDRIKENPYRLCREFHGIGFVRADQIAASIGIEKTDESRLIGGLRYLLATVASRDGHTCLPRALAVSKAAEILDVPEGDVACVLESEGRKGSFCTVTRGEETLLYEPRYYAAEMYIAKKLCMLDKLCPGLDIGDAEMLISEIEHRQGIAYAAAQREAIRAALTGGIMILTGGPGTGKTTVIRGLIEIFDRLGMASVLAAPTGRAAKRMSEATQCEAFTVHRLLEMEFRDDIDPAFARNEDNLLEEEVIIVDEVSMMDTLLLASLLRAIKPGARLILIGDANQLPSVGAGHILHDLIASGAFSTVALSEVFRQSEQSLIIQNAHRIHTGAYPELGVKNGDFFFLARESEAHIAQTIGDLCEMRLPRTYGEDITEKIQIISPSKKGEAGTEAINRRLQALLNPPKGSKNEHTAHGVIFREGDRVMQIRNNYTIEWTRADTSGTGVFNGDIGVIEEIDLSDETMTVAFDDKLARYDFSLLDELELAYAITVHKSQGSEYPVVIMPIYPCAPMLLTRNLLYTAITRAQRMVILVGRADIVRQMVDNDRQARRFTGLQAAIAQEREA